MPYEIGLLGGFSMRYGGESVDGAGVNRLQALIAYLALHRQRPIERTEIAFKLWPDSNEAQAHTNLRKALHHIKHQFPQGGHIQVEPRTIELRLSANDCLDLADFEAALHAAEEARGLGEQDAECTALESAAALYRGELLPNCCDEWLAPAREHLRERFILASERLVELLEARQQYRDAIVHARRLLQMDNLREENHRALIRLHALNNDRAAALSAYHACASILARELSVEPEASTRELYERLLHGDTGLPGARAESRSVSPRLVGREKEWTSLTSAWKAAAVGPLRMLVLRGEAGIGKTRLAEDFLRWAQRQGVRTAFAACYATEGQASYAPVASWLRALPLGGLDERCLAEISRIFPECRPQAAPPPPITEGWQKQAFHEAMARAVLGQGEPCLIMLDDIHWCDADLLDWIRFLMRFDAGVPGLLVVTLRTEEVPSNRALESLLIDLRGMNRVTELELERLDGADTQLLGAQLAGKELSPAEAAYLFQASEGVPLFVVELARAGILAGQDTSAPDTEAHTSLPPRLRAIVEGRLARLTTGARAVVDAAAVIGREFSFDLLRLTSELDESTTIGALDELWRRRLIRERGSGVYDFSHDKLREVALAGISPIRLRWLHQRAAEALLSASPDGAEARIGDHFEQAGKPAEAAAFYARAARHERGLFALHDALAHFTRALLFETGRDALAVLHEERGDVLYLLERREDAFDAFQQAFGLADAPLQRARVAHKQIDVISRFRPEVARERYEQALKELESASGQPGYWSEWIQTKMAWITASYWQQNLPAIDALLKEARLPVERHGTLLEKIHFRHMVISGVFVRRRYRVTRKDAAYAAKSIEMARTGGNPYLVATMLEAAALSAYFAELMPEAEHFFAELIGLSEKLGDDNTLRIGRTYLSVLHRRLHRVEACLATTRLLEGDLARGSPNANYQGMVHANHAWIAYTRGEADEARRHAQLAMQQWTTTENPYPFHWCALLILLALAVQDGRLEDARTAASGMLASHQQRLIPSVETALVGSVGPHHSSRKTALAPFKRVVAASKACGYL